MQYSPRSSSFILATAVLLAGPLLAQEVAKEGTFTGNWTAEGRARTVELGTETVQVLRLAGPVKIRSTGGLAREFTSECVGVSREGIGGIGRCSWTDDDGDKIFMELAGRIVGPAGTARDADGKVVGGTGKYRGLEGEFHVEWLFLESHFEEGKIMGRDTKTEGSWRRP